MRVNNPATINASTLASAMGITNIRLIKLVNAGIVPRPDERRQGNSRWWHERTIRRMDSRIADICGVILAAREAA